MRFGIFFSSDGLNYKCFSSQCFPSEKLEVIIPGEVINLRHSCFYGKADIVDLKANR